MCMFELLNLCDVLVCPEDTRTLGSSLQMCGDMLPFPSVPLDEVVEQELDALLQLRFLQGDGVALVGDLHDQLPQFVQLAFDLEEALGRGREPEEKEGRLGSAGRGEDGGGRPQQPTL